MARSNIHPVVQAVIGALAGGVAGLFVAPISQILSFELGEHLSRPILSIEYVEPIIHRSSIRIPTSELAELVGSPSFQFASLQGIAGVQQLRTFQTSSEQLDPSETERLRGICARISESIGNRLDNLAAWQDRLEADNSESDVREIATQLLGSQAAAAAFVNDVDTLKAMISSQINYQVQSISALKDDIDVLTKKLSASQEEGISNIVLKVSVLNQGRTDGLIRNIGEMRIGGRDIVVPLHRTEPVENTSPKINLFQSVPVTVTNQQREATRRRGVGSVDSNSMSEYWFEADRDRLADATWERIEEAVADPGQQITLVLYDQDEARVEGAFSLSDTLE